MKNSSFENQFYIVSCISAHLVSEALTALLCFLLSF